MPSVVPDPVCPLCSKPVRPGGLVVFEHGELFHVQCRSQQLRLRSLERIDHAEAAQKRAARLVDRASRSHAARTRARAARDAEASWCPLCRQPATITDWRPRADWLAIEGCSCGGFFLRAGLLPGGLGSAAERQALAASVRGFRALGHEVWLAHANDARGGPLTIRTQRPDLPK